MLLWGDFWIEWVGEKIKGGGKWIYSESAHVNTQDGIEVEDVIKKLFPYEVGNLAPKIEKCILLLNLRILKHLLEKMDWF